MYRLIVKTTNDYPHYERQTFDYLTLEMAERTMERISKDLNRRVNIGTLQDYEMEIIEKK